jgi:hypothetical protein
MKNESHESNMDLSASIAFAYESVVSNQDEIINETLKAYFPKLDEKEFLVCKFIVMAHHDLGHGCYGNIRGTVADHMKIFRNEIDVENTIKALIQRGIVKFIQIKEHDCEGSLTLDKNLQDEIIRECESRFDTAFEQNLEMLGEKIVKKYEVKPDYIGYTLRKR